MCSDTKAVFNNHETRHIYTSQYTDVVSILTYYKHIIIYKRIILLIFKTNKSVVPSLSLTQSILQFNNRCSVTGKLATRHFIL